MPMCLTLGLVFEMALSGSVQIVASTRFHMNTPLGNVVEPIRNVIIWMAGTFPGCVPLEGRVRVVSK